MAKYNIFLIWLIFTSLSVLRIIYKCYNMSKPVRGYANSPEITEARVESKTFDNLLPPDMEIIDWATLNRTYKLPKAKFSLPDPNHNLLPKIRHSTMGNF